MRVLVLGAGASFHVGYPLTRDLCPKLIDWASRNEPPNQRYWPDREELSRFSALDDIEELISQVEKDAKPGRILAGLRNALCEYFDSVRAGEATLYRQLAQDVVEVGDVVVSLNYDVSLDRELRRAGKWEIRDGYGFDTGINAVPQSSVKLLKLHGSTNWIDSLFGGVRGGSSFSAGFGFDSRGSRPVIMPQEFDFLEYQRIRDPQFNGGGVDRAGSMILPSRNKRFHVATSINPREREHFWASLWGQAAKALQEADEIAIIGYSLPEADTEARKLVFESSNRDSLLTLCCGRKTRDLGNEFLGAGFERHRVCTDFSRFEDWLVAQRCEGEMVRT